MSGTNLEAQREVRLEVASPWCDSGKPHLLNVSTITQQTLHESAPSCGSTSHDVMMMMMMMSSMRSGCLIQPLSPVQVESHTFVPVSELNMLFSYFTKTKHHQCYYLLP